MYVHVFLKAGLKYLYFSLPDDMISATLAERQMTMTVTILIEIMTMVVTMVVMMLMTIMMTRTMVVMMLMLMMMVMTVHNFTPWWMLTPAAINFTPHAWKTADVSLSPALPSSSSNRLHHNRTTLYRTTGGFIALLSSLLIVLTLTLINISVTGSCRLVQRVVFTQPVDKSNQKSESQTASRPLTSSLSKTPFYHYCGPNQQCHVCKTNIFLEKGILTKSK